MGKGVSIIRYLIPSIFSLFFFPLRLSGGGVPTGSSFGARTQPRAMVGLQAFRDRCHRSGESLSSGLYKTLF